MNAKLKQTLLGLLFIPVLVLGGSTLVLSSPAGAADPACDTTKNVGIKTGKNCAKSADQKSDIGVVLKQVTNVLLFLIGAVAVIMIIIGGIRYVTSNGDSSQITAAKNTILYSVVGIVVALLAYAIVNFVTDAFVKSDDSGGARVEEAS